MTPNRKDSSEPTELKPGEPEVLLFETSPFGTLDAIVQHDGRAIFFYLNQSKSVGAKFGTRACWVRNLKLGPYVINQEEMRAGISPMLPRTDCVHREGQPLPNPDNLEIVWLEEGNGAALIEKIDANDSSSPGANYKTLAVIPPWSGLEGFNGYALECASESPLCWPMPDNPKLETRIQAAREFWDSFRSGPNDSTSKDPFQELQKRLINFYDSRFKKSDQSKSQYYSIDGGTFPPRGLVVYQNEDGLTLVTVGMSLCPQPAVEIFSDTPQQQRRVELAIWIPAKTAELEGVAEAAMQKISGLAGYPWRNFTWFGAGHTCAFQGVFPAMTSSNSDSANSDSANPDSANPDSAVLDSAVLLQDSQFCQTESALMEERFRNDPINLLWLLPVSENQKELLKGCAISFDDLLKGYRN